MAQIQAVDARAGQDQLTRWLLAGGVIGPLLFIVVFVIEEATRPGYSAWSNFVSQLSLSNQGWEQIANFLVCGLLCFGFAVGLRRALRTGKGATWGPLLIGLYGLALVVAGTFATDPGLGYPPGVIAHPGQPSWHAAIHALAGLFCFTSLGAACFVLARRFASDPAWQHWVMPSISIGAVVILSLVVSNLPGAPAGVIQRVGIIAGWLWVALFAWRLLHQEQAGETGIESRERLGTS